MMNALNFVKFSQLQNWSVQYASQNLFNFAHHFPFVEIGSFLFRRKDIVEVKDDICYKRITVKSKNGGIVVRDELVGKKIGTKHQYRVKYGQFALSKIDARNGAFGVVPKDADNSIITSNFWTYDIDSNQINPFYLSLLTTTQAFVNFADKASNGTTNRHYLQESLFLSQKIPLPQKSQQDEIVSKYKQTIAEAEAKESEALKLENEIERYLLNELSADVIKPSFSNGLNFVRLVDTKRWDVPFFISSTKVKSQYGTERIGSCLDCFMEDLNGKSIRVNTSKSPNNDFHYLGMENVEKNTGELIELPMIKGKEIKSQTLSIPQGFFIYGKLRPYLNKYWHNDTGLTDIVCSSEFFVFHVKPNINADYFKYVLASSFVQKQLSDSSSGARMPRINEKIFKNIQIPIPPIDIQNEIVVHISELKMKIKSLKQQATMLKNKALNDFEKEIFE